MNTCRMRPTEALMDKLARTGIRSVPNIRLALDELVAVDALERVIGDGLAATGGNLRATAEYVFRTIRENQK